MNPVNNSVYCLPTTVVMSVYFSGVFYVKELNVNLHSPTNRLNQALRTTVGRFLFPEYPVEQILLRG